MPSPAPREPAWDAPQGPPRPRSALLWDGSGAALVATAGLWSALSGLVAGADPRPFLGVLAATALAYLLGRQLVEDGPRLLVAVAGLVAAWVVLASADRGRLTLPLHYDNADAALVLLGAAALALGTARSRRRDLRAAGVAGALAGLFLVALLEVAAAVVGGGFLALAAVAAWVGVPVRPRRLAGAAATLVAGVVAVTVLLGSAPSRAGPVVGAAESTLTSRRLDLWHDALQIVAAHPLTGVGPGRFSAVSPVALSDVDASWAHSLLLGHAAETGIFGAASLAAVGVWAVLRLGWAAGRGRPPRDRAAAALIGVGTWTAFGLESAVDYIATFPAVPVLAGLILGAATKQAGDDAPGPDRPR